MIRRGDIYFAQLNPAHGREQAGRRPVLVVSDNAINNKPLVVTVVVGTDAANVSHDYPINVRVRAEETGLLKDSIFLCFQLRSLDPDRLKDPKTGKTVPAGSVPEERMQEIESALKLVLGMQ